MLNVTLRASTTYQQLELASALSEENIFGLSAFNNPGIIGQIMTVLRFPKDGRLLATMESAFYNQSQLTGRQRHPRVNLAECLDLAEVLLKDQRKNNRQFYLPQNFETFRGCESG